MTPGCHYLGAR